MTIQPLTDATFAIQMHVLAAFLAFLLGGFVLFRRKGDRIHRIGGRVWAALMLVVIVSSFFIHTIRLVGPWSPIHLLSFATLWFLFRGVAAARLGRIVEHRATMRASYLGSLVIAGGFAFLPGRIMHSVFFEGAYPWIGFFAATAIVAFLLALALRTLRDVTA